MKWLIIMRMLMTGCFLRNFYRDLISTNTNTTAQPKMRV